MNILLLAFALPIATILLAIVLQKILKCPLLVAATFFAILLIITFAVFDVSFLIFAIIFTILAYITAVLTRLICKIIKRFNLNSNCNCICSDDDDDSARSTNSNSNCNVSNGTWSCTARNEPIMILTNSNDIVNSNDNRRSRRNCYNCCCNRR